MATAHVNAVLAHAIRGEDRAMKKVALMVSGFVVAIMLVAAALAHVVGAAQPPGAARPAEKPVNLRNVPDLPFDPQVVVDNLKMPPELALGEVAGVDTDSKGNIYIYSRTG